MNETTTRILCVAVGGALGALSRYWVTVALSEKLGGSGAFFAGYPWGTTVVNLLGCLVFGLLVSLLPSAEAVSSAHLLLLTGFLGAFTTFSTFAFETAQLLRQGRLGASFLNLALQNVAGLLLICLGVALGGWCLKCLGRLG